MASLRAKIFRALDAASRGDWRMLNMLSKQVNDTATMRRDRTECAMLWAQLYAHEHPCIAEWVRNQMDDAA